MEALLPQALWSSDFEINASQYATVIARVDDQKYHFKPVTPADAGWESTTGMPRLSVEGKNAHGVLMLSDCWF